MKMAPLTKTPYSHTRPAFNQTAPFPSNVSLNREQMERKEHLYSNGTLSSRVYHRESSWHLKKRHCIHIPERIVYLRLVFVKIGDIDTVKEKFDAELFIESQWKEPTLTREDASNEEKLKNCWDPKIFIDNAIGDLKVTVTHELDLSSDEVIVTEKRRIRGNFFERMELNHFPFDTQDLSIVVTSERSHLEVDLQQHPSRSSRVIKANFMDTQEWSLHTHVDCQIKEIVSDCKLGPKQRPSITFTTRAGRRWPFYILNIWIVGFVLCCLAFCVFALPISNIQGRLQLSFILFLTNVTFKFVVTQHLPRISYLTIMDKALMTNLALLLILCVWHSVISKFYSKNETVVTREYIAIIVFAGLYLIVLLVLALFALITAGKRRRQMKDKDREFSIKWHIVKTDTTKVQPITIENHSQQDNV